jgi:hypothetical protein
VVGITMLLAGALLPYLALGIIPVSYVILNLVLMWACPIAMAGAGFLAETKGYSFLWGFFLCSLNPFVPLVFLFVPPIEKSLKATKQIPSKPGMPPEGTGPV